jgi:hypothetical protein
MTDEKVLTTRELATRLKLDPKKLRALLREMGKGAKGDRYEFRETDLPKLIAAIKDHAKSAKKQGGKHEKN